MKTAQSQARRRAALSHIAAVTAGAVGLSLLVVPDAAAAQPGFDCAALGEAPMAGGVAQALEAAIACDIEVRVEERSTPYSTVYATPQRQLHVVSTASPSQLDRDRGFVDPTLTVGQGALRPTHTTWPVELRYGDASRRLLETPYSTLDWNGETPVPSYAGASARYDGLAPGLDLAVDVDTASAGLRFTAADADAWQALATGLTVVAAGSGNYRVQAGRGMVIISDRDENISPAALEWTTPFTVRDAAGSLGPVTVTHDEGSGALTLNLPETFLRPAAFPLRVFTQWAGLPYHTPAWGSVTSAASDLSLYRGKGGLDAPYFQAAGERGDAVVGSYCDRLVDPGCVTTAQARSYWLFPSPDLRGIRELQDGTFYYPVVSATLRVDAAEGAACVAPDLHRRNWYLPQVIWSESPTGDGDIAGGCQGRTAVYDLTALSSSAPREVSMYSFMMAGQGQTARFDGGSARLDVYVDLVSLEYAHQTPTICGNSPRNAAFIHTGATRYGGFRYGTWRPDLLQPDFRWHATFYDGDTGAVVLTTAERPAVPGSSATYTASGADALGEGRYRVVYTFRSGTTGFTYEPAACYISIDLTRPTVTDISVVSPRPHYVGDTVTVAVTVADKDFPDGWNSLRVQCSGRCSAAPPVTLIDNATATFEVALDSTFSPVSFGVRDKGLNNSWSDSVVIPATYNHRDYDQDGQQDLLAIRKSDGHLMFYAGRGDGSFAKGVSRGAGWGAMDILQAGDLTGDGHPDLLARDRKSGKLYTYPGDGNGGVQKSKRILVGSGWNAMGAMTSAGDFNGNGKIDLLAISKTNGKLYLYPGRGDGTFGSRKASVDSWRQFDAITTVGGLDSWGPPDLIARHGRTGKYYLRTNHHEISFSWYHALTPPSLGHPTGSRRYGEFTGVGDLDGDGYDDLVAVDSATGELVRHSFDHNGKPVHKGKVVGTGWGRTKLPAIAADRTYDYNNDRAPDVIARQTSNGKLYAYPGNGKGGHGKRTTVSGVWRGLNLIETAGDFNGDGRPDIIAREKATGRLWLYPGTGNGKFGKRVRIGTGSGWNKLNAIAAGHDFNGDGIPDIIAREKATGRLWLYPGTGKGKIGKRVRIGTGSGWNKLKMITAVGDLNHDGHADLIAVQKSNNCLYFYPGNGKGGFKSRVKISCGWKGMDSIAAVGDFDGDGRLDWVARRTSDGKLYLYRGNGKGGHHARKLVSSGWKAMNLIV